MRTWTTRKNQHGTPITYKGTHYFFLIHDEGVGIRRKDGKAMTTKLVKEITEYLFEEGFANREDYE